MRSRPGSRSRPRIGSRSCGWHTHVRLRALAHAGLGDLDAAFSALDEACADRDLMIAFVAIEPRFAALCPSSASVAKSGGATGSECADGLNHARPAVTFNRPERSNDQDPITHG